MLQFLGGGIWRGLFLEFYSIFKPTKLLLIAAYPWKFLGRDGGEGMVSETNFLFMSAVEVEA